MFHEVKTLEETYGEHHSSFDWWQASVDVEKLAYWDKKLGQHVTSVQALCKMISDSFPMSDWIIKAGSQGYQDRYVLVRGDTQICTISAGGCHDLPNVSASGSNSGLVRSVVTGAVESGKASRIDSAFDSLSGSEEFQKAAAWLEDRAKQAGINCRWITNSDPSMGNTLYVGGKSSRVMIRLYEKGKQTGHRPGEWWRAEVQLRPDSKAKSAAYHFSPGMVWSASRITRDLWAYLGGEKLQAAGFYPVDKDRDLKQRLLHLATQYGNLLAEALSVHFTPDGVFQELDNLLSEQGKQPITGRVAPVPECPF